jgi:hypothetical protein
MDGGDVATLAKITTYDEQGMESIRTIYAGMPATIRTQYPTPGELMAFFFVADTLLSPPPGMDVAEKFTATETGPGRAFLRRPGATGGGLEFIQTAEGWKCVVPAHYPAILTQRILGNEMLATLGRN